MTYSPTISFDVEGEGSHPEVLTTVRVAGCEVVMDYPEGRGGHGKGA
ncbi:hypothetical protein KIPB_014498, partial [Kipferlia bialata]|eukprot:g14498.t1